MKRRVRVAAVVAAAAWLTMAAGGSPVAAQYKMTTFYLCLLVTPAAPAKAPADAAQLQLDHLANLKRIMESGKGVIAGPIEGEGRLRGILVLRVNSMDEARAMADADPAPRSSWELRFQTRAARRARRKDGDGRRARVAESGGGERHRAVDLCRPRCVRSRPCARGFAGALRVVSAHRGRRAGSGRHGPAV